jgi:hypothetical protein
LFSRTPGGFTGGISSRQGARPVTPRFEAASSLGVGTIAPVKSQRIALVFLVCLFACGPATPALAADPAGTYTSQLTAESDALLQRVIRRPYGWAWDSNAAGELPNHPSPRTISMASAATPAAGLILLWTGEFLNEPRYIDAAREVARGIAACQLPVGRVPNHPVFASAPGGRPEIAVVPDRTATNAALGLLLALVETNEPTTGPAHEPDQPLDPHDEAIHRSAERCARWLAKQEAPNGVWPSIYPSDAAPNKATRIIRLDDPDYRNSTLALLLSFDLLHDDVLHHFAQRPLDGLMKLRLVNDAHGPGLWCTACTVDGSDIPTGFPNGPDVMASRYVMQTLFAGYLFNADPNLAAALNQAAKSLGQDKRPDGLYDRFLDPTAAADIARELGNVGPTTQSFFGHPSTQAEGQSTPNHSILADPSTSGSFGIPELLDAIAQLKSLGGDHYAASFTAASTFHQQIEASLCGLSDGAIAADFPKTAKDITTYLAAHNDHFQQTGGSAENDLASRVRRLSILLIRAKVERLSK